MLDFCEIQELFEVKADHIFRWIGQFSRVHEKFPRKFVSLIRIENRKKSIMIRIEPKITNDMHP